ncbi:hypothetical protein MAPG_10874 [Magnaporthiopsis poae ATCC 64411]|uniref:Uncharacterized protein n=1 Tax=Magnaporthiopsis poae (strain ATCC 64411 / 73-15) TaxID=644358 RepID=A0A0C4EDR6_MAGP6|nr:hypothetical protein MAPG_10874 [Magnaporthiopsis poae ATCC 64411]
MPSAFNASRQPGGPAAIYGFGDDIYTSKANGYRPPDVWVQHPSFKRCATADRKARKAPPPAATQPGCGLVKQHGALATGTTADDPWAHRHNQLTFSGRGLSCRALNQATLHRSRPDTIIHTLPSTSPSELVCSSSAVAAPTTTIAGSTLNGSGFLHNPIRRGNHSYRSRHHYSQHATADHPPSDTPPRLRDDDPVIATPPASPPVSPPSRQYSPIQP